MPSLDPRYTGMRPTIEQTMMGFGMDPNAERLNILPNPNGSFNPAEWTAPQWLYDLARAAALPGHVAQGGQWSPENITDMAMNVGLGGSVASMAAPAPAGAFGVFAGRSAKTADLGALAKAEKMAAGGDHKYKIWSETGWFRDADGKWKFEIDDSAAKLNPLLEGGDVETWSLADGVNAKETLSHGDLYSAYPDIASIPTHGRIQSVFSDAIDSMRGLTSSSGPMGAYDGESLLLNSPIGKTKSTMLHELQHAIQEREGFARGGSPRDFSRGEYSILRDAESQIEAINSQLKAAAGTPRYFELMGLRQELVNTVQKLRGPDGTGIQERAQKQYRALAGEAESRNVQTRMGWPAAKRRAMPPWLSRDVPEEELTIKLIGE